MKKSFKRALSTALCLIMMVMALIPSAFATEISSDADPVVARYERLFNITSSIYISPTGMAESSGSATSRYSTDRLELAVTLQRRAPGTKVWHEVESWYATNNYVASVTGKIQVDGGYEFRTRTIVSLYESDGTFVEAVTIYSGTDIY